MPEFKERSKMTYRFKEKKWAEHTLGRAAQVMKKKYRQQVAPNKREEQREDHAVDRIEDAGHWGATEVRRHIPSLRGLRPMSTKSIAEQRMRQSAIQTEKRIRTVTAVVKKVEDAAIRTATEMGRGLIGLLGGGVLLMVLIAVVVVAAVVSSPFGIFFAGEQRGDNADTVPLTEAVAQVEADFNDKLEQVQMGDYDRVEITGQAPAWAEVLAVFAVRYAGAEDGIDVTTLDADRVDKLTDVFWDMTAITPEVKWIGDGEGEERILHIAVIAKTADEMKEVYNFTDYQCSALDEVLREWAKFEVKLLLNKRSGARIAPLIFCSVLNDYS